MSDTLRGTFSAIADSIRTKGVSGTMTPLEMPSKIASIEQMDINDIYNLDSENRYGLQISTETVTVNYENRYRFALLPTVSSIEFPNLSSANNKMNSFQYMCQGCTNLVSVEFPLLRNGSTSMFDNAFNGCVSLGSVSFDSLSSVTNSMFSNAFNGCTSLSSIEFPELQSLGSGSFSYAFRGCTGLRSARFPKIDCGQYSSKSTTFSQAFYGCQNCEVHLGCGEWVTSFITNERTLMNAFSNSSGCSLHFDNCSSIIGGTSASSSLMPIYNAQGQIKVYFPELSSVTNNYIYYGTSNHPTEVHFAIKNETTLKSTEGWAVHWGFPETTTIYFDL